MGRLWYTTADGKRKRTKLGNKMEYKKFQSSAKAIAERSSRNAARRAAVKRGAAHKGDGKDVHHTTGNPMDNSHTRVISRSANRGKAEKSRLKGSKRTHRRRG